MVAASVPVEVEESDVVPLVVEDVPLVVEDVPLVVLDASPVVPLVAFDEELVAVPDVDVDTGTSFPAGVSDPTDIGE